jgi:hypothetical protein
LLPVTDDHYVPEFFADLKSCFDVVFKLDFGVCNIAHAITVRSKVPAASVAVDGSGVSTTLKPACVFAVTAAVQDWFGVT